MGGMAPPASFYHTAAPGVWRGRSLLGYNEGAAQGTGAVGDAPQARRTPAPKVHLSYMIHSSQERVLRQLFKYGNRWLLLLWRLGLGTYGNSPATSQVMVLTHIGRKSGRRYRTPVNYAIVDGAIYCTAGFGRRADWYRNLRAHPQVEVWLREGWWAGVAQEVTPDDPGFLPRMRQVLIASGFAAPLFAGIRPTVASDADLAQAVADYPLMRIQPTQARTGPGGPGDLAWVWPAATGFLLARQWRRRSARQ